MNSKDQSRAEFEHNQRVVATRALSDELQRHGINLSWPTVTKLVDLVRAATPTVPQGCRVVPVEPTEEMFIEGMEASCVGRPSVDDDTYVRSIWNSMLAAAPTLPQAGWMPIESAPKEGAEVLLMSRKGRIANGCWMVANNRCGAWLWPYVKQEPAFWMPLPQPPKEQR